MSFPSAYEALISYLSHLKSEEREQDAAMVKSAFRKVLGPALNLSSQLGPRATAQDDAILFDQLKQIPFNQLLTELDNLEGMLDQWKSEEGKKY